MVNHKQEARLRLLPGRQRRRMRKWLRRNGHLGNRQVERIVRRKGAQQDAWLTMRSTSRARSSKLLNRTDRRFLAAVASDKVLNASENICVMAMLICDVEGI